MAYPLSVVTLPESPPRQGPIVAARHRRRKRRGWLDRQRSSRRGRFELAIFGGGGLALVLAGVLPGLDILPTIVLLGLGSFCMGVIASYSGFIPAMAAALFAPLVVALTDPMWTLGATILDFTLGSESLWTFICFSGAAIGGSAYARWRRNQRNRRRSGLWRAQPARKSSAANRIT